MVKEIISTRQGLSILTMYLIGSSIILGTGMPAKQDVWIVILISMLLAIPITFVYARILTLYPEKDLFDIAHETLGSVMGKIISILYIWYAFHLGALVIRNFSEFIQTVSISETPQFPIVLFMSLSCIWAVRAGIEVIGRWATFVFPYVITIILALVILPISEMNFINIKPVLYNGMKPVMQSVFHTWSFPFAESVLFIAVFNSLKEKDKTFRIFFIGLLISSVTIILASLRNILVLGSESAEALYFASYSAVSVINIGEFFQRIEVLISIGLMSLGFVKVSICLFVVSKGVAKLFGIKEYKEIAAPIGFMMAYLSMFIYKDLMEMVDWAKNIYSYYAIPFQIIIPIGILIIAEIKKRYRVNTQP